MDRCQQKTRAAVFSSFSELLARKPYGRITVQENHRNILGLFSCESNEIFLRCFKESLNSLVESQYFGQNRIRNTEISKDLN